MGNRADESVVIVGVNGLTFSGIGWGVGLGAVFIAVLWLRSRLRIRKRTAKVEESTADMNEVTAEVEVGTVDVEAGTAETEDGTADMEDGTADMEERIGQEHE